MSLFDWVELGMSGNTSADKALANAYSGFVDIVIGDAVYGVIGSEYDQFFGPYVFLVCDIEDMILSNTLEKVMPFSSALLGGVGGSVNFIYGTEIDANYIGPMVTIRRAPTIEKESDNLIRVLGLAEEAEEEEEEAEDEDVVSDPVDEAVAKAVGVMSILMCALDLAIDLTLHFKYPEQSDDDSTGYNSTVTLLKELTVVATSRLMALIRLLEEKGSLAGMAEQMLKEAKFIGLRLTVLTLACIPLYGWVAILMWNANESLDNALEDTAKALSSE